MKIEDCRKKKRILTENNFIKCKLENVVFKNDELKIELTAFKLQSAKILKNIKLMIDE